jgi:hypothetical protein
MLNVINLLIALVIAASFGIGSFLYYLTKEEIDSFKAKFANYKWLSKAKNIALAPIGILGIVEALATTTKQFESISLILLAIALIFGSFVIAEKSKKLTLKYILETALTFLIFFVTVYFIISLLTS